MQHKVQGNASKTEHFVLGWNYCQRQLCDGGELVDQYTRFVGIEGVQEANAHFCGEHTSIDAQGYLERAVETGERATGEVINDLQ